MSDSVVHRTNAQTPPPKFLMVGVEVPAGVRLYASRHMPEGLAFGQVEVDYQTLWHVEGALSNMLVITKPTWNEALAELFQIWSNQDANERGLPGPAARPSPWKPIGGVTAIAPPGTPAPRARSIAIDQPLVSAPRPESTPPQVTGPIVAEGRAALTSSPVLRQPAGITPRTAPPGKDWPWPHDVHECTDDCPPEVRQPPRGGICGECGATWRLEGSSRLPEHSKGALDLGVRCPGSGALPIAQIALPKTFTVKLPDGSAAAWVQPGPDDQGEAEFVAGTLYELPPPLSCTGVCNACEARFLIQLGGPIPEHLRGTTGEPATWRRCDGSGTAPVITLDADPTP